LDKRLVPYLTNSLYNQHPHRLLHASVGPQKPKIRGHFSTLITKFGREGAKEVENVLKFLIPYTPFCPSLVKPPPARRCLQAVPLLAVKAGSLYRWKTAPAVLRALLKVAGAA
jgi:hypothetical protein